MTHPPRSRVEFLTTSPRLARLGREAIKRDKSFARLAEFRPFDPGTEKSNDRKTEKVVLSTTEDIGAAPFPNYGDSRFFHLLFTGMNAHPDSIARWMRATRFRHQSDIHIVPVEDLQTAKVFEILARVGNAHSPSGSSDCIIDAYLIGETLNVLGPKHRLLRVPLDSIRAFAGQTETALRAFEVDPDGSFVYWPKFDAHLGWNQFLQIVDPTEHRKAQQKSEGFNERYGAAIRKLREAAGISQAKIEGLTERQLRRIERGEFRATASALTKLARAHGLSPEEYLENLARALG